jgi:hypothetical protein
MAASRTPAGTLRVAQFEVAGKHVPTQPSTGPPGRSGSGAADSGPAGARPSVHQVDAHRVAASSVMTRQTAKVAERRGPA